MRYNSINKKNHKGSAVPKTTQLPSLPDVVDPYDLQDGRIAPLAILDRIGVQADTGALPVGRVSKSALKAKGINCDYDVMIIPDPADPNKHNIFAIYSVFGDDATIGKGTFGAAEIVQDKAGKFWVQKTQSVATQYKVDQYHTELDIWQKLGRAAGGAIYNTENGQVGVSLIELADGVPLSATVELPLTETDILIIMNNIMKALDALHQAGILHLDIKPDNIIVNPHTKEVRLIDFGISLQHKDGKATNNLRGSPSHMPVEIKNIFIGMLRYQQQMRAVKNQDAQKAADQFDELIGDKIRAAVKSEGARNSNDEKAKAIDALLDELDMIKKEISRDVTTDEAPKPLPFRTPADLQQIFIRLDPFVQAVLSEAKSKQRFKLTASKVATRLEEFWNAQKLITVPERPMQTFKDPSDDPITYSTQTDIGGLGNSFADVFLKRPELAANKTATDMITRMCDSAPEKRPDLASTIQTLDAALSVSKPKANIALIDIDTFYSATTDEKYAIIKAAKKFDAVQLIAKTDNLSFARACDVRKEIKKALMLEGKASTVLANVIHGHDLTSEFIKSTYPDWTHLTPPSAAISPTAEIKTAAIQRIPDQVNLRDLSLGQLLSDTIITQIKAKLKAGELTLDNAGKRPTEENPGGKISASKLREAGIYSPYSVYALKQGEDYQIHAIYKGVKHKKELSKGKAGNVVKIVMSDAKQFRAAKTPIQMAKSVIIQCAVFLLISAMREPGSNPWALM